MSDRPNETLIFDGSQPAHPIQQAQSWALWAVAALLAVMDGWMLIALLGRG